MTLAKCGQRSEGIPAANNQKHITKEKPNEQNAENVLIGSHLKY